MPKDAAVTTDTPRSRAEVATVARKLMAEFLGTLLLVAVVIGSGIMAEGMAAGNGAVALLGNTLATGAILVVLITILGPVSGAHFNPAVTLAFFVRRDIAWMAALGFVVVQVAGGAAGAVLANTMFDLAPVQAAQAARTGPGQWLSEGVATFGLVLTILGGMRYRPNAVPALVGLYISAGYWFTASTSFANPAVAMARTLSDTFSGIMAAHVPAFVAMQLLGALVAVACARALFEAAEKAD